MRLTRSTSSLGMFLCEKLVSCLESSLTKSGNTCEDLVSSFGPNERFWCFVVNVDVVANGGFKVAGAAKDATPQLLRGQESKPTLDEIEPRSACWGEVKMKTWALQQPALNGGRLMSTVVVEDQMDVKPWWHLGLDLVEELAKLDRAMAPVELANNLASLSVQGGEQRSGTVALVIMNPAFCLTRSHGQNWLRAIQSLNLRFLVNAEHQSLIRRIHIKPHYISYFVDEQRILGKFEALATVRGQSESSPHPMDAAATQAASCRQRASAPVRSILRRGLQGHRQHSLHFNITQSSGSARSRLIQQTIEPFIQKARTPLANHLLGQSQARRYRRIRFPLGTRQNDPGPLGQRLARLRSSGPLLKRLAFVVCQSQRWYRSSYSHQFLLYN